MSWQTDKQFAEASSSNQRVLSWSKAYFYTIKVLITNQNKWEGGKEAGGSNK